MVDSAINAALRRRVTTPRFAVGGESVTVSNAVRAVPGLETEKARIAVRVAGVRNATKVRIVVSAVPGRVGPMTRIARPMRGGGIARSPGIKVLIGPARVRPARSVGMVRVGMAHSAAIPLVTGRCMAAPELETTVINDHGAREANVVTAGFRRGGNLENVMRRPQGGVRAKAVKTLLVAAD